MNLRYKGLAVFAERRLPCRTETIDQQRDSGNHVRRQASMRGTICRRLLAFEPSTVTSKSVSVSIAASNCSRRFFSSTPIDHAEKVPSTPNNESARRARSDTSALGALSNLLDIQGSRRKENHKFLDSGLISSTGNTMTGSASARHEEPHHLHVFAHKHNCHMTLTTPKRDPLLSLSNGNIGFRHSGRKHYDSAFQLAGYFLGRVREQGLIPQIQKLEVTLRGFGPGREAVTKALLGQEGRLIRNKIIKVSDATRLKFGGTRSRKPRRLG